VTREKGKEERERERRKEAVGEEEHERGQTRRRAVSSQRPAFEYKSAKSTVQYGNRRGTRQSTESAIVNTVYVRIERL
jgi:hypothetical protein